MHQATLRIKLPFFLLPLLTLAFSGCISPVPHYRPPAKAIVLGKLPKEPFWWGTSTASFQNEDRGCAPGSKWYYRTDWDCFADEGGAPPRGDEGVFSWSEFDKDLAALRKLGVNHFRFGVEWARIEPRKGVINEAALRQYGGMARKCREAGIEPLITLWHFTFPDWLCPKDKSKANFLNPDVRTAWQAHVRRVVKATKGDVRIYIPQNEPNGALQLGWLAAHWPPGLLMRPGSYKKAMRVSADMFRDAAGIVREERSDALIMGIYSLPHWNKARFLDPTRSVYNLMQHQNFDQLDMVADTCDLIGVNYYYSQQASAIRFIFRPSGEHNSGYTQLGWEIVPTGLYHILKDIDGRYHKPIVISENGIGTQSGQKSIRYFREHIAQMRRAINEGVDVRGYFPWTLVDNYEWTEGWNHAQFGLFSYDKKTHNRIPTPSALWYAKFIEAYPEP
ncbi:MAG: family 1 glycosylhydrolase [Verrucomicrobia bacterium]|nr:family 1 glycosylhydrolase [Verrucomicrobiota bacterium]